MSTLKIKDGTEADIFMKGTGVGTELDPFVAANISEPPTKPLIISALGESKGNTTLASNVTKGDTVINVVSAIGMLAEQNFFIVDSVNSIVEEFKIISIATNAITVDMPSGNDIASGTYAGSSNINMAVDGSVTPVKFNLKTGTENVPITLHLTRIMIVMETLTAPSIHLFGDLPKLINGIYLRKTNGETVTYFNVKSNGQLMSVAYDVDFLDATKFGVYGVKSRFTFEKLGAIVELAPGEDLELWVQDDLSGLVNFGILAEGHINI